MYTARLRLEPLAPAHAAELFPHLQAPALYTFIDEAPPASIEALAARYAHLASGGRPGERWRNWLLRDRASGAPVGTLQATLLPDRALVAYAILPPRWRQGLATEALAWLVDTLRAEGVAIVEALIDTRNTASIRLVERLGFRRIETIVAAAILRGEPSDEHRYRATVPP